MLGKKTKHNINSSNCISTLQNISEHRDVDVPLEVAHKIIAIEIQPHMCHNSCFLCLSLIFRLHSMEVQVVPRGAIQQDNYSKNLTYAPWACRCFAVIISPVGWNF